MSIEKLERVCWRLRKSHGTETFDAKDLRIAIMKEIGTDERTERQNVRALLTLGWIAQVTKSTYKLTGGDVM